MTETNSTWPVLKRYDQQHLARIALPLGGIGTGTVSLGGRGDLRDWEIMNRPAKGFVPLTGRNVAPFFALFCRAQGDMSIARAIEGPIELADYEGSHGSRATNHGLPRFRQCEFAAAYPLGQVLLSDADVPLDVRIEAFNPLLPNDADASGMPLAVLRFVLINPGEAAVEASVCGSLPNFIGMDGSQLTVTWGHNLAPTGAASNVNTFRQSDGLRGIMMESQGVGPDSEQWGTIAIASATDGEASFRTAWADLSWGDTLLDFWDDFSADGRLEERRSAGQDMPVGSLAIRVMIPPRGEKALTFLLTWHFPNRGTWTPTQAEGTGSACCPAGPRRNPDRIGNYYTTRYRDAWHVAQETARDLPGLEMETICFTRAVVESSLPEAVREAALFNIANLRSQTCFRTADGRFFGFEGCHDHAGCCPGSCTHVWNYEHVTAFLFGELARSMRETEFLHATRDDGLMSFRVHLPIARASEQGLAAADGQMGCLMRLYREWQLSGDDDFLRHVWPKAREALGFCWIAGGWDADQDGVMEGCQHNTMDVEYYGPNPQMGAWYLGALRACEEMARHLGEIEFADRCHALFENGSHWVDEHLFNGEYYEHQIRPPEPGGFIAEGLRVGMGADDVSEPALQLGAGCLVDQLVGQYMAHVCGLGHLLDPDHVATTMASVMRHNFHEGFHDHFNHMRSFVLGDEAGLVMATYPRGRRPERPFPYYNEVMTGFEYAAAIGMLYEGQLADGLRCIEAIRDRYDGRKRSPFDEAECGHHYARAMAAWAAVPALSGFQYSAVSQTLELAPRWEPESFRCVWAVPSAWGVVEQTMWGVDHIVRWEVRAGELAVRKMRYRCASDAAVCAATVDHGGTLRAVPVQDQRGFAQIELADAVAVCPGEGLVVRMEVQ